MQESILVAGAGGALGQAVVRELLGRGARVIALCRRRGLPPDLEARVAQVVRADARDLRQLRGRLPRGGLVFSCLGGSVRLQAGLGRRPYSREDVPANCNLIEAACHAGVRKFVYVGVAGAQAFPGLDYVRAHERVAERLARSGLAHAVVKPTGFFSVFESFLALAARGSLPLFGDGSARTNPIDDRDLAIVCAEALEKGDGSLEVGGPEVLTRRRIGEMAFEALGKEPRFRYASPLAVGVASLLLRPFHPRFSHLIAFAGEISRRDMIAPARGTRRLSEFFAERAGPFKPPEREGPL